jgi:hypothetical protein
MSPAAAIREREELILALEGSKSCVDAHTGLGKVGTKVADAETQSCRGGDDLAGDDPMMRVGGMPNGGGG